MLGMSRRKRDEGRGTKDEGRRTRDFVGEVRCGWYEFRLGCMMWGGFIYCYMLQSQCSMQSISLMTSFSFRM